MSSKIPNDPPDDVLNTCEECGSEFRYRTAWRLCPVCEAAKIEEMAAAKERVVEAVREERFLATVPPLYHETDKARLSPCLVTAIDKYRYGPRGLAFLGRAGEGKTRSAVLVLRTMALDGHSTQFLPATKLAAASAEVYAESADLRRAARETLRRAAKVRVLLLDDVGKNRMTDRAEVDLYEILEARTSHQLPTLWTSNSTAAGLHAMFSPDRADALIRRLGREFCDHVTV